MDSMDSISVLSPAKINLFLHIVGRRDDGYHLLQSVFLLLAHGDTICYTLMDHDGISLQSDFTDIPEYDNLICRAARLLLPYRTVKKGVRIELQNTLPTGAGLGGGSSNAGTTLHVMNHLWRCHLDKEKLLALALQLGADVPFFVHGKTAFVEGIGEQLSPIESDHYWYLVVSPKCHIDTGKIFRDDRLTRHTPTKTIAAFLEGGLFDSTRNDCEALVRMLYPDVNAVIEWMEQYTRPRMTGTGSSVFGRFPSREAAEAAKAQVPAGWKAFVARDIPVSPVIEALARSE